MIRFRSMLFYFILSTSIFSQINVGSIQFASDLGHLVSNSVRVFRFELVLSSLDWGTKSKGTDDLHTHLNISSKGFQSSPLILNQCSHSGSFHNQGQNHHLNKLKITRLGIHWLLDTLGIYQEKVSRIKLVAKLALKVARRVTFLKVGNGDNTLFCVHIWVGEIPLKTLFHRLYSIAVNKNVGQSNGFLRW